jgi:hypothetical protein
MWRPLPLTPWRVLILVSGVVLAIVIWRLSGQVVVGVIAALAIGLALRWLTVRADR